jgi:endosialidase-like protein
MIINGTEIIATAVAGGGSTPRLDQVLDPTATKTFTLGANSLTFTGTSGASGITLSEAGSSGLNLTNTGAGGLFITDTSAAGLNIAEAGTGKIFIRSTSASTGEGIQLENDGTGGSSGITLTNTAGGGGTAITDNTATGITIQSTGAGGLVLQTTAAAMQLLAAGIVYINPTAGSFHVQATDAIQGNILMTAAGATGVSIQNGTVAGSSFQLLNGGNGGMLLRDSSSAGLVIQTSTGTGALALHTNATGGLTVQRAAGTATAGLNTSLSGGIQTLTTIEGIVTAATATSDERLKTNIQPFTRGLDAVVAISPKTYQWNKEGQKYTGLPADLVQSGLIAQDVQKVIPEAIGHEGDYLSIDNRTLLAVLINAIKELAAENDSLKVRIATLETE